MLNDGAVVTKTAPCPICSKTDWCYSIGQGDTVRFICRRVRSQGVMIPNFLEETETTDKEGDNFLKLKVEEKAPRPNKTIEYIYLKNSIPVLKVVTKYLDGKKQGVYPYIWSESQWNERSGLGDVVETSLPLYNHDAVVEAKGHVFLVEGESCAKSLNDLGFVATTIRGKTFSQDHIDVLSSKKCIVLCPDRDTTGVAFMTKAQILLTKTKTPLKQLLAPPHDFFWAHLPNNGGLDVADWIKDGASNQAVKDAITALTETLTGAIAPEVEVDQHTRLEQNIKLWIGEESLTKQALLGVKIRRDYHLDKATFDKIVSVMHGEMTTAPVRCRSGKDFMNEGDNEISWLLSNMIARGEIILLSGSPGRGKSVFAMFLIHKMLKEGAVALNERVMRSCKVLFISGDQSDRTTRKRFREMGTDKLPEFAENVRILSNFSLETLASLESELEKFRPDLVVIDSLTSITLNSAIAEKDPEFAHAIYRLKDLFSRYDAASILIHHLNKSGDESGSLRIKAAVWAAWRLESAQPDNLDCKLNKLTMPKVRDSERLSLELEYNEIEDWQEKGVFTYMGEIGSGKLRDDVLSLAIGVLEEYGTMPTDELAVRCNTTLQTLGVTLSRAKNKGLVTKSKPEGCRYALWSLTASTPRKTPKQLITAPPRTPMRYPNISDPKRQDVFKEKGTDNDEFF